MYNALPFHALNDAELLMEFGVYTSRRCQIIASAPHTRERSTAAWAAFQAHMAHPPTNGEVAETRWHLATYELYGWPYAIDGSFVSRSRVRLVDPSDALGLF
ncbi:hypothetical protein C8R46DRAFT_1036570 [Mycena filopes]|nr:hypothetical protein C8R46DRAFT_1036570 [Mycena filopes]